jgi:metacaspase-1
VGTFISITLLLAAESLTMADKAVLFGINKYKTISHLRGCVNDVKNVAALLTDILGFSAGNVRTRTDEKVTKKDIQKQWAWLLEDASPGDRLILHFSGHGSYTTDNDGDESDGVDELLCLFDMDWDDGETYLLDDDIRQMTSEIPEGVLVTFLFDSCHSGTATRALRMPGQPHEEEESMRPMVDVTATVARLDIRQAGRRAAPLPEAPTAIGRAIAPETPTDAQHTVLARFVPPPANVMRRLRRAGIRRRLVTMRDADAMNHVLFSGSQSDQTSADAYIAGDFHGAFSYHFCTAIRQASGEIDHQDLIGRVRHSLVDEGFSQVPQLEPDVTRGPVFRRRTGEPSAGDAGAKPEPSGTNADVVRLLERLVELLETRREAPAARDASTALQLVYVHGICRHEPGYSDPWWRALKPQLSSTLQAHLEANRHEVLWSEIVSPTRDVFPRDTETVEERMLADSLRAVLEDRAERQALLTVSEQAASGRPVASRVAVDRALFGIPGLDCVDDFAKYLLNDSIRDMVLDKFLEVLEPLLRSGANLAVISHSWGTVVAYEGLRALDGTSLPGRVLQLFTVGSALSIGQVRRRLRTADGARPDYVREWINLDASGDVVGGALQPHMAVDREFLQLQPVGCNSIFGVVAPACAHGSYFRAENRAVNGGIFAEYIER